LEKWTVCLGPALAPGSDDLSYCPKPFPSLAVRRHRNLVCNVPLNLGQLKHYIYSIIIPQIYLLLVSLDIELFIDNNTLNKFNILDLLRIFVRYQIFFFST
jgi:hypothetical protein